MQFRCYTCGHVFANGMPPIDALSDMQAEFALVNDAERDMKSRSLVGTKFEGMSSGSFCEFCLVFVHEFPSAKGEMSYELAEKIVLSMGWTHEKFDIRVLANRWMKYFAAQVTYPNYEEMLSLLNSLLTVGIEKTERFCALPACNRSLGFRLNAFHAEGQRCNVHNFTAHKRHDAEIDFHMYETGHNWFKLTTTMENLEDTNHIENFCDTCQDRYGDWWAGMAEASQEYSFEGGFDGTGETFDEWLHQDPSEYFEYPAHNCTDCNKENN